MASLASETVAHHSLRSIIDVVRRRGNVSRRQISTETGLSTPTVTRHVTELIEAGVLGHADEQERPQNGPGRPPSLIAFDPGYGLLVGADVGEHTTRVALGDFAGGVLATTRIPSRAAEGYRTTLNALVEAVEGLVARGASAGSDALPLRAVAVGIPGIVDPEAGVVAEAPNFAGWRDVPVAQRLRERFGPEACVRVENDVNLAAVGEFAHGAGRQHDDFVFVSVRQGIGAGIFLGGRLLRGRNGMAGELGFMAFGSDFDYRRAGGLGHLETLAGEQVLLRRADDAGSARLRGEDPAERSLRELCLAARDGDGAAGRVLDHALERYGVAVANIASLLDPGLVVIGGDLVVLGAPAVERIGATLERLVPHAPELRVSGLGEDAALRGAFHQAHLDACATLPGIVHQG